MPFDRKPCMFRAFKGVGEHQHLPPLDQVRHVVGEVRAANPTRFVRGPSFSRNPMSISSQYNFSASGCSQHFVTVPTLMSNKGAACSGAPSTSSPCPPSGALDGSGAAGAGGALGLGALGFFSFFFSAGGALGFSCTTFGGGLALGALAVVRRGERPRHVLGARCYELRPGRFGGQPSALGLDLAQPARGVPARRARDGLFTCNVASDVRQRQALRREEASISQRRIQHLGRVGPAAPRTKPSTPRTSPFPWVYFHKPGARATASAPPCSPGGRPFRGDG